MSPSDDPTPQRPTGILGSEDALRAVPTESSTEADMDVLVVENYVLRRSEQPKQDECKRKKYIESFKLD